MYANISLRRKWSNQASHQSIAPDNSTPNFHCYLNSTFQNQSMTIKAQPNTQLKQIWWSNKSNATSADKDVNKILSLNFARYLKTVYFCIYSLSSNGSNEE
jgi:hypothetical protein